MEAATAMHLATVERLKDQIRKLQAATREYLSVLRTGIEELDGLLPCGGFPLGQALELWGEAASGRTSLALRTMAAATREHRLVAYVDGPRELYPPAAAALGLDLERCLIVRPKAPGELVWATVQLLRSGAFTCVTLDLTHTGVRLHLAQGKKLLDAAVQSGTVLLLLTPPEAPGDGLLRFRVGALGAEGLEVEVLRSRQGGMGKRVRIAWHSLYPALAGPLPRWKVPSAGAPPPIALPKFHRVRASDLRNGPCGLYASRPGRDATSPSLAQSLGVSSSK
jgi:recombination protein RecA